MPCFCWIGDNEIEPEMKIIRDHAKEIVKLANKIHGKGDLSGGKNGLPRFIMDDIHKLLDDLWSGKCDEKPKSD